MRPVIDDETAEMIVQMTDDEFKIPSDHVQFEYRLEVLIEKISELKKENEQLKRELEDGKPRRQQGKPW